MVPANVAILREPADERLMPPQAIDAEMAILGGILLDPNALVRIADRLPDQAFYIAAHKTLYRAALALHQRQEPIDLMTMTMYLMQHNQLEGVGGKSALVRLIDTTVSATNIDAYADLVLDKWRRRRMGELGRKMLELQHDPEDWKALYEGVEQSLMKLAMDDASTGLRPLSEIQVDMFTEIERNATAGKPPGIPTGFVDLDAVLQGFQRGDLIIVAARPSMGKTAMCLNIAANIAAPGLPVAIFSLEMSQLQLAYRLTSAHAQIETSRLRAGKVAEKEWTRLGEGIAGQAQWPVYIDDTPSPGLSHIVSQCRRLKAQKGDLGMVFIDYLQLMDGTQGGGKGENESQQLAKLTRRLKMMARELDAPVVVLSQLSRGVESRTDKRPVMSDLRSSGAIEQDADVVMMLYREEYYTPDTADRGIAEVLIRKNRNGPVDKVQLLFQPEISKFRSLARGY